MNELKSPNAPGRPLLRNSSEVDESFVPSIYGRTLHSEAHPQVASPFACNGSQKFGTASNNDSQNWPIINNISTSEFKQEFRYPGEAYFENAESVWANSYAPFNGSHPHSSHIWSFNNPTFSHSAIQKDNLYDASLNRVSQPARNIGLSLGNGLPMSPLNRDMSDLGQQMIDHVLSNSPNNVCKYQHIFVCLVMNTACVLRI